MLKLRKINLEGDLRKNIHEASGEDSDAMKRYLCRYKHMLFVSGLSLLEKAKCDSTMPPNSDKGCIFANPKSKHPLIPINELEELYYIVGGDLD